MGRGGMGGIKGGGGLITTLNKSLLKQKWVARVVCGLPRNPICRGISRSPGIVT